MYIYSFRIKISNYYLIARQRYMLIKRYPRLSHPYIYIYLKSNIIPRGISLTIKTNA